MRVILPIIPLISSKLPLRARVICINGTLVGFNIRIFLNVHTATVLLNNVFELLALPLPPPPILQLQPLKILVLRDAPPAEFLVEILLQ